MDNGRYVTEAWLAEHARLVDGGELRLPTDCRLTPAARDLLAARSIRVRFTDDAGRQFVDEAGSDERRRVHPLTGSARREAAHCRFCGQSVGEKPAALTHLDATTLVAKNDPRIALRGRLDSAIAQAVLLQEDWRAGRQAEVLQRMLADLRGALGSVLRAEVLGEVVPPILIGEFNEDQIHAISHDPLKYLGHDHVVPELGQGPACARLNVLRAAVREAEVAAAVAFIDRDGVLARGDLLQALNRLSSAAYVLMLMAMIHERRRAPDDVA